jgi:hypothetical protein
MMDYEAELKKVRQEAANYRTQLAPYKKAFSSIDKEAVDWFLDTVAMIHQNPNEAGTRFASLAYGNLGEDGFTSYVKNVLGDSVLPSPTQARNGEEANMDDAQFQQWASQFEQKMMSAIQQTQVQMQEHFNEKLEESAQRAEYDRITGIIRNLGYDPDSWQGKLLVQVASDEAEGVDPEARLRAADSIVRERVGPAALGFEPTEEAPVDGGTGQQFQIVGGVQIPVPPEEPTGVPATGGTVGGGGVPNGAAETPSSFRDADDALMGLLNSIPGQ